MHHLSIDLETFSSVPIAKAGAQKYISSPDFEILLFAYSLDGAPVEVIDLTTGAYLPPWLVQAITSPLTAAWSSTLPHRVPERS